MLLHSLSFVLVFLPLVVAGAALLAKSGRTWARKPFLLAASLVFYVSSGWSGLPVLAGSILLNYLLARRVAPSEAEAASRDDVDLDAARAVRRRWLVLGISANVAILGVFKYAAFFVSSAAAVVHARWQAPALALPLGVSFFTISQIMHLVDCYEEVATPLPLLEHALFACLFPYVTAGPLVHTSDVVPELDAAPDVDRMAAGVLLFVLGLAKKVVVADTFGRVVDASFAVPYSFGVVDGWATALSYTLQVYADFSGYSDMALGAGMMLGLSLPENFNSPFKATSVIDFWRRWHISLSSFITTYLYTPMARAVRPLTLAKATAITFVSMTIAGLWHGPAWTYVAFGALHGVGIAVNHLWKKTKIDVPTPVAWAMTFTFVIVGCVVFRAATLTEAGKMIAGMLGANGLEIRTPLTVMSRLEWVFVLPILVVGGAALLVGKNSNEIVARFRPSWAWALGCAATLVVCLHFMNASATKGFIYRGF